MWKLYEVIWTQAGSCEHTSSLFLDVFVTALLWLHTAAATGPVLWHLHSQSFHRLCGQQREQHTVNIKGDREHAHTSVGGKQLTRLLRHSAVLLFITCLTPDAFLFVASAHFRPLRSCCIHSNFFYRLTMNHFFVWIFFFLILRRSLSIGLVSASSVHMLLDWAHSVLLVSFLWEIIKEKNVDEKGSAWFGGLLFTVCRLSLKKSEIQRCLWNVCSSLIHGGRQLMFLFMGYKNAKLDFWLSHLFNIIALVNVEIDLKMLKYAFRLFQECLGFLCRKSWYLHAGGTVSVSLEELLVCFGF